MASFTAWLEDLTKRKLRYTGHIMRGSSVGSIQLVLESYQLMLSGEIKTKDNLEQES